MQPFESDYVAHAVTSANIASVETKVTTNQAKKKKKKKKNKPAEQTDETVTTDQRSLMPGPPSDMTVSGGSRPKGPFIINSHTTEATKKQSISKQRQGSNGVSASREERNKTSTGPARTSSSGTTRTRNDGCSFPSPTGGHPTSDTASSVQSDPQPFRTKQQLPLPKRHRRRVFGSKGGSLENNSDSAVFSPPVSPDSDHYPVQEEQHEQYHQPPPLAHPFPLISLPVGWPGYPSPFNGSQQPPSFFPLGIPNAHPQLFGAQILVPQYGYPNPMYGAPVGSFTVPGDCTHYSPMGTPLNYENGAWLEDGSIHSNGSETNPSHVENGNIELRESDLVDFARDTIPCKTKQPDVGNHGILQPQDPHNSVADNVVDSKSVSAHLLEAFISGEFADHHIVLGSSSNRFHVESLPIHGLIASRSPHLRTLMKMVCCGHGNPKLINLVAAGSFVQPKAFQMALQHLYGLPLLTQCQLADQLSETQGQGDDFQQYKTLLWSQIARIDFALCYLTSGVFLANKNIVLRGIELATHLIDWDTVETVLHFGLAVNDFVVESSGGYLSGKSPSSTAFGEGDEISDGQTDTSNPDKFGIKPAESYPSETSLNKELHGIWAPRLLSEGLAFIANNIPMDFELDIDAHTVVMPDRIPTPKSLPRTILSNPHLASMKFGDFEPLSDSKPSRETTITSAILLSLPFVILEQAFNIMQSKSVLSRKMAEDIVFERERRRLRTARAVSFKGDPANVNLDSSNLLAWEESVSKSSGNQDGHISLIRTWVGVRATPGTISRKTRGSSRS